MCDTLSSGEYLGDEKGPSCRGIIGPRWRILTHSKLQVCRVMLSQIGIRSRLERMFLKFVMFQECRSGLYLCCQGISGIPTLRAVN